jgi:hypothetical protein
MEKRSAEEFDIIEEKFGKALGAEGAAYREKITLFIAHKDRDGNPVPDVQQWIERAESVLSGIGGGATSQLVRGAWQGKSGPPLHEDTTLVYSYAPPRAIAKAVDALRDFMHEYGRETRQAEVVLSLENPDGNWFFKIPEEKYGA